MFTFKKQFLLAVIVLHLIVSFLTNNFDLILSFYIIHVISGIIYSHYCKITINWLFCVTIKDKCKLIARITLSVVVTHMHETETD